MKKKNLFVYIDPGFLSDGGHYLKFADRLHENGNHFMISYVLDHNGKSNETVKSWIKERGYRLITLEPHHVSKHVRHESLIVNY